MGSGKQKKGIIQDRNPESIKTEPIWNNKNIRYKGYPLFYNRWCRAGIEYLQDLWSNGHMMSYEEIRQKAGTSGSLQFEYNTLVSAIPESWKIVMNNNNNNIEVIFPREIDTELGPLSKLSNKMIRSFFDKQKNHDICAANFWKHKLNVNIQDIFSIAHECTKETRLRLLQFKFIHNIYPTNILLNKMGLVTTNNYVWCSELDCI